MWGVKCCASVGVGEWCWCGVRLPVANGVALDRAALPAGETVEPRARVRITPGLVIERPVSGQGAGAAI